MKRKEFYKWLRMRSMSQTLQKENLSIGQIAEKLSVKKTYVAHVLTTDFSQMPKTIQKDIVFFSPETLKVIFELEPEKEQGGLYEWFGRLYTSVIPEFARVKAFIRRPEASPELDIAIRKSIVEKIEDPLSRKLWNTYGFSVDHKLCGMVVSRRNQAYTIMSEQEYLLSITGKSAKISRI